MPNPIQPRADKWFYQKDPEHPPFDTNRRQSIRYIRNDIGATVQVRYRFFPVQREFLVELLDIGSSGALIAAYAGLPVGKKILLTLHFPDHQTFKILGTLVRTAETGLLHYGVKFDRIDNDMAEHLVKTQKELDLQ